MKVKLLPLAIGAAIAMPGVALADGPTVYGKMNVTLENSDLEYKLGSMSESADTWEINSNASRFGIKGSEEISDGLSAFYQAEYEIFVDDGTDGRDFAVEGVLVDDDGDLLADDSVDIEESTSRTFKQRDIFVGLKGGWGSVQVGNFDTPLKKAQGKVDQFNDMAAGDLKNIVVGENREANLIQYSSPAIADAITLNVAVQAGEEYCPSGSASDCQDGPAENFSVSAVYNSDMIYAAVAMDDGIDGWDATRLSVVANLDAFEVGFLYQMAEESEGANADEQDGYVLSAAMKLGSANKLRAQYGSSEYDVYGGPGVTVTDEVTQFGLGFDHKLSKQTKLFANYIMLESEISATGSSVTLEEDNTRLQFGVEHKF